ncbi:MAG: AraC family transcriptional regulator [Gemmatimonadaceae bacterium]
MTHRFAPHWHDEFALGVVESGAVRTRVGTATVTMRPGALLILNPGDVHTGEPCDGHGYTYRMLYVGAALLHDVLHDRTETSESVRFDLPVVRDARLASRLAAVHAALMRPAGHSSAAVAELVDTLDALARQHASRRAVVRSLPADPRVVGIVREYLEDNHARVVTLAELATLTGRSPFYVSRTFRSAVGVPPYAYLALARVCRARELLAAGFPASMVTHTVGFSDQSHFIRQFKRVVGLTPGQYSREVTCSSGRSIVRFRSTGAPSHNARLPRQFLTA